MEQVLVLLILLASPDDRVLADQLAADLQRRAGEAVTVVIGEPARERLTELGITPKDLLVSPNMGRLLTRQDGDLAVLHISQRMIRGDSDLDCRLWFEGRRERLGGVVGEGGDVYPILHRQVVELLGHRFGDAPALPASGPVDLAALVEQQAWTQVLLQLAAQTEPLTARSHYYKVLAYSRLDRRQAAVEAYAAMREAHGQHFLVAAALEVLPAEKEVGEPDAVADPEGIGAEPESDAARADPAPGFVAVEDVPMLPPSDEAMPEELEGASEETEEAATETVAPTP